MSYDVGDWYFDIMTYYVTNLESLCETMSYDVMEVDFVMSLDVTDVSEVITFQVYGCRWSDEFGQIGRIFSDLAWDGWRMNWIQENYLGANSVELKYISRIDER